MSKAPELMQGILREKRHLMRFNETRYDKAHKSRYERRKVKAFLRHGEWLGDEED